MFLILRTNLNGFEDLYHGTNMGEWFTEATFRTPFPLICLDVSSTFYLSLGIYFSFCVSFFIAIGCNFSSTHANQSTSSIPL
jgi:hypothetical protein